MRYCKDEQIDRYVHHFVGEGWFFWRATKHGRLRSPLDGTLSVSSTPSDRRAAFNLLETSRGWYGVISRFLERQVFANAYRQVDHRGNIGEACEYAVFEFP